MSIHVRDGETEAERLAVQAALEERLRRMQAVTDTVAGWPVTGLKADKTFFDAESGD
ncbi:transcription factor [Brevundimonas sp.]|uniref:transcription factor n=1 Tax=Brevundimonas sp. TaxID=1871086 RepID=UPI0039E2C5C8